LTGTILVPAHERVFCLFHGVEADVRAVSQQPGIPFERVLEALRIDDKQPDPNELFGVSAQIDVCPSAP